LNTMQKKSVRSPVQEPPLELNSLNTVRFNNGDFNRTAWKLVRTNK
jgi:hypothetical protein